MVAISWVDDPVWTSSSSRLDPMIFFMDSLYTINSLQFTGGNGGRVPIEVRRVLVFVNNDRLHQPLLRLLIPAMNASECLFE